MSIRGLLSCPQLLSGLSLQSLFWAAGPQVSAPICLSPTLPSPNAACPSWGARCLPAACPPACSMPKLSACRLLERTELPSWPGPHPWSPASPWRGWVTWLPLPEGHRSSSGSCPGRIGPSSAGQAGGSESLLARGQSSLTLKQNRRGSQKPGSLTHSLTSSALPPSGGGDPGPLTGQSGEEGAPGWGRPTCPRSTSSLRASFLYQGILGMNPQPLGTTLPPQPATSPSQSGGLGESTHPESGLGAGRAPSTRAGGCAGPPEGYQGGKDGGARPCSWGQPGANPLPTPGSHHPPALQLPLANDGGSRSPSSESSPQHPTPPARPRHMLGLPSTLFTPRSMER